MTEFFVEERAEQPWVGVPMTADLAHWTEPNAQVPRIFAALADAGHTPQGGPIYQYRRLQRMSDPMDIVISVPVSAPIELGGGFSTGELPAGRYLVARPAGGPDVLAAVHAEMWEWAQRQQLRLDIDEQADGIHWAARTEQFHTDPNLEPDRSKWSVEVGYLLR